MRENETDLTKGSPWKVILQFSVPILLTYLLQQFYSIVDTMVVGRFLGKDALAGVGSTGSVNFMIIGFCMGICMGFVIPVAQRYGARDFPSMRKFFANSIWLAVVFSIVITVIVRLYCRDILVFLKTPDNILNQADDYISVIFLGIPVTMAYNLLAGVIRSVGDSKTPFIILMMASVVNIGFDILSVTVLGMGVKGPAMATVLSQAFSAILCLVYIQVRYPVLRIQAEEWGFKWHLVKILCCMGIPMGLQYSITAIGSVVLQTGINSLGSGAVAAVSAASRITAFTGCPTDALGASMATYAGQNLGAKKFDRIGQGLKAATVTGMIYSVILFVVLLMTSKTWLLLFVSAAEKEIIENGTAFLMINASAYCLLVIVNTFRFTIQGLGYSGLAIISGIMEMVARAVVGVALVPAFGFISVCFGSPAAWVLADIFLIPAYCCVIRQIRKKYAAEKEPAEEQPESGLAALRHRLHRRIS